MADPGIDHPRSAIRDRALRSALDHREDYVSEYAMIVSIAHKLDLNPEMLREGIRQYEIDGGLRSGIATEKRADGRELDTRGQSVRRLLPSVTNSTVLRSF